MNGTEHVKVLHSLRHPGRKPYQTTAEATRALDALAGQLRSAASALRHGRLATASGKALAVHDELHEMFLNMEV